MTATASKTPVTNLKQAFKRLPLSREQLRQLGSDETLQRLEKDLAQKASGFPLPPSFCEQLIGEAINLLDVPIPGVLSGAWSRYTELRQYRDPEQFPPDETFLVPMAQHVVHGEYTPTLEPMLNRVGLGKVTFTFTVDLTLQGVVLKVRDGRIQSASLGGCLFSGTVSLGQTPLATKESDPLEIQDLFEYDPGILILDPLRDQADA